MRQLQSLHLIQRTISVLGIATFAVLASLPGLAQNSSRPGANQSADSPIDQPGASETPSGSPSVPGVSSEDDPGMARPAPGNTTTPGSATTPGNTTTPNATPRDRMNTPGANSSTDPSTRASADLGAIDQEFIMMAAQGNNAEIQMSQLALQQSTDDQVKAYAQRMIDQHTAANRQLEQLAAQRNITLPTTPAPLDVAVMEKLSQLSGANFDRAYIGAQVNAHMRSMAVFRTEAQQGEAQDLMQYATRLLPDIQDHYEVASRMVGEYSARQTQ